MWRTSFSVRTTALLILIASNFRLRLSIDNVRELISRSPLLF